ncbi:hypothetical protein PybrP1_000095 [[Pythium] brassicae (nom. inval.)]|nr:hypothetical protein PybrP1_000095 [[Pythium] brassicae (nom. inval.)]
MFDSRGAADEVSAEGVDTSLGGREERVSAEYIVAAFDHVKEFVERAAEPTARTALDRIRAVMSRFRAIALYFRRSLTGKHRLLKLQSDSGAVKTPVGTLTDCLTRWSSCRAMLQRLRELQPVLGSFFGYLRTREGAAEFPGLRLDAPSEQEWFVVRCLLKLLGAFVVATDALSGETYPKLPTALPFLRALRKELTKSTLFYQEVGDFGSFDFIEQATEKVEAVCAWSVALFDKRFGKIHDDLVWASFLDPQLSRMTHLSEDEVEGVRQRILSAADEMSIALTQSRSPLVQDVRASSPNPTPTKAKVSMFGTVFGRESTRPRQQEQPNDTTRDSESKCEAEIILYLNAASHVSPKADPLSWWRINTRVYPILAALAREWLGCVATPVPSEGILNSRQRSHIAAVWTGSRHCERSCFSCREQATGVDVEGCAAPIHIETDGVASHEPSYAPSTGSVLGFVRLHDPQARLVAGVGAKRRATAAHGVVVAPAWISAKCICYQCGWSINTRRRRRGTSCRHYA